MFGFVPEDYVINGILEFDQFENFYSEEYAPRKTSIPINWFLDPIRCRTYNYYAYQGSDKRTGNVVIGLAQLPTTFDEAFLIAHEIEHVIRKFDGLQLPIKYHNRGMEDIASRLGSMFDDPIIDSFLQTKYNFNPVYHYTEIDIPRTIEVLKVLVEPEDDIVRLMEVFYYTTQLLQWSSIKDPIALEKWHKYQVIHRSKSPNIVKMSEELYAIVQEIGVYSLEKERQLFNRIVNMYIINNCKLEYILYIE